MMVPENLGPELSKLVAVADFNNMILLHYSSVELQLFFFELRQSSASNIDSKEIRELGLRCKVAFISLYFVLQASYIIFVLEHGRHSFLTRRNIFYVRLGLMKLFA